MEIKEYYAKPICKTTKLFQAVKKAGVLLAAAAIGLGMLTGCKKAPERQEYGVVSQEQDGDNINVVLNDCAAYALDMPVWDGRNLTFSDGTIVSSEEYGEIVIRDQNGNEVDRYTDVERENKFEYIDYGIVDIREEGNQSVVHYVFQNEETFKENRPMWDGRVLIFGKNDIPLRSVGTDVKAYIIEDQDGNELATYIPDYESMSEDEYNLSRIIKSIEKNGDITLVNLNVSVENDDVDCFYDDSISNYFFRVNGSGDNCYGEEMNTRFLQFVDYRGNVICEYDKCPDNYSDNLPGFVINQDYDGMYLYVRVKNGTSLEELKDYAHRDGVLVFKDGTSFPNNPDYVVRFVDEADNEILVNDCRDITQPYVWKTMQDSTSMFIYLCDDYKENCYTMDGNVMTFIDGTKVYLKVKNISIVDRDLQVVDEFTVDLPDNIPDPTRA